MSAKNISTLSFKVSILYAKFCSITCNRIRDRTITRILEKIKFQRPYRDIRTQIESLLFLMMHILYLNFCAISSTRNRDELISKIPEKVLQQRHLLSDFHQKLTKISPVVLDHSGRSRFLLMLQTQDFKFLEHSFFAKNAAKSSNLAKLSPKMSPSSSRH